MQPVCLVLSALSLLQQKTLQPSHASVTEKSGGRGWSGSSTAPAARSHGLGSCRGLFLKVLLLGVPAGLGVWS